MTPAQPTETGTPGTWTRIDVGGRPAEVYEPPGPQRPRFGILHLHDLTGAGLHDQPLFTHLFAELRLACVCPQGGPCWWVDRVCPSFDPVLTPERYLLESVLPFFQQRWGLGPRAVGLTGVSMGGQGALRLAFRQPDLFPVVAALAATLDLHELYNQGTALDVMYDSKEQCRQDTATMHIHPSRYPPHLFFCIDPDDPWLRGNERLHEKLAALGVAHEVDFTTRAGGHSWSYFNHQAGRVLRFVAAGLEQESRRLL